jgi:hypothetical protein
VERYMLSTYINFWNHITVEEKQDLTAGAGDRAIAGTRRPKAISPLLQQARGKCSP